MRIASFNVQNLRLRVHQGESILDGARDTDTDESASRALDLADRALTARVIADIDADIICLQEVFDQATLDYFHDSFLRPTGIAPYPHRICVPGNDGRGRDLAMLSRRAPDSVASHARVKPADLGLAVPEGVNPETPVFRRDCLMVRFGALLLVLCHFKAPYPDASLAWKVRRLEALAVRHLLEAEPGAQADALWLIAGDLNEPAEETADSRAIQPLLGDFSVDLLQRLPAGERWSFVSHDGGPPGRPDALLASPALARRWPDACPEIVREGMSREITQYRGPRLAGVGQHRPHASDHAAVVIALPGA